LTRPFAALTALLVLATLVVEGAAPAVRTVWTSRRGDMLHVRASGIEFITGAPLVRLKDGRSIRVALEAATAPAEGGPFDVRAQAQAVLSYDLWEERFAVSRVDVKRSISHLAARDAEAWCLEQLAFPLSVLRSQSAAFWIRLTYRLQDEDQPSERDDQGGFTLRGLIDRFSRRAGAEVWADTVVSGPIRIE
jgi:hypothetical protein